MESLKNEVESTVFPEKTIESVWGSSERFKKLVFEVKKFPRESSGFEDLGCVMFNDVPIAGQVLNTLPVDERRKPLDDSEFGIHDLLPIEKIEVFKVGNLTPFLKVYTKESVYDCRHRPSIYDN